MTAGTVATVSPLDGIDASLAERLLGLALSRAATTPTSTSSSASGADYVARGRAGPDLGRGITLGLGVRVLGDATGYAYTEDLAWERWRTRRGPPARSRPAAAAPARCGQARGDRRRELLRGADAVARVPAPTSSRCCARRQGRARVRPAHRQGRGVVRRRDQGGAAVHLRRPHGHDIQPLMRFGVRAVAEDKRQAPVGLVGGGGPLRHGVLRRPAQSPEAHGREAARVAIAMLDAREAPAGEMAVVLGPGDSGILLHEAVGHGLEADFNRKETSNYSGQIGKQVASPLCTVVDDGTIAGSRGVDQRRRRGQRRPEQRADRERRARRLHARPAAARSTSASQPTGNGRRESFRYDAAAAHDEHLAARRASTSPRRSSRASSAASTPSGSPAVRSTSRTATSCSR